MLATLIAAAGLVAASCVLGQGVLALCGTKGWRAWSPAVGLSVLLALGGQIVWVPGRAVTLAIVVALLVVAALALGNVRAALREAASENLPLGGGVLVAAALPLLVSGRAGVLGVDVSNDMSAHLLASYWLRTHDGPAPVAATGGDLLGTGYPVGPHGVVAALAQATGIGEVDAFTALTLAVPVLTALVALGALPRGPRLGRLAAAAMAALTYLAASYLAQGAFKETIEALLLLATGVALSDLSRRGRGGVSVRTGVPVGVLVAGTAYAYSYGGLVWPVGAALVLLAAEVLRRRGIRGLRRAWAPVAGGLIACLALAGPDIGRMLTFAGSFFASEPTAGRGNLFGALSPLEALGVWFAGDYRLTPAPAWPSIVLGGLAVAALVAGLGWWWRRGALGVPAALAAGVLIWADLAFTRNIYNAAKGLIVLAPVAATCLGAPLVAAWRRGNVPGRRGRVRLGVRGVGLVLLAATAVSSFTVLRDARVGLGPQEGELDGLRRVVAGDPVLFLGLDHFAQWELRGAFPYVQTRLYGPRRLGVHPQKPAAIPFDVDNYGPPDLDLVRWVITPGGAYQSRLPGNFRRVRRTPSFVLYRRVGPTREREPLEPPGRPGAVLACASPEGARMIARYPSAAVLPAPVVLDQAAWHGQPLRPGDAASVRVRLPPGRWDVSLQYAHLTGLAVDGPGLHAVLPPYVGRLGPFWPAGVLRHRGGAITVRVTARPFTALGRLLGASPATRVPAAPGELPLNQIAFTRHGTRPRHERGRAACGRWVDFYAPDPPRGRG